MTDKLKSLIQKSFNDEDYRRILMFNLLNIVLGIIAFIMTVINVKTNEGILRNVTWLYSSLCFINYFSTKIPKINKKFLYYIFLFETVAMLTFFIVTGIPQGFSVLWTLIVPSFAMAIFGMGVGISASALLFFIVILFFWMPFGKDLLLYDYSETFMLRFPFVYICLFLLSLYLEYVRRGTHQRLKETYAKLQKSEENYKYFSRHDSLTRLYSRHGFYEETEKLFDSTNIQKVAAVMLDIDDFKMINDNYGHNAGDEVLKRTARIILNNICNHALCCRWGGEEFLIITKCNHNAYETSEKIRKAIENTIVYYENFEISFTISAGVAEIAYLEKEDLYSFINLADKALYQAKANGKNQTVVQNNELLVK